MISTVPAEMDGILMEFLTGGQLKAVETAIRKAREERGIHLVLALDGEAYAYQFNTDVHWQVN